MTEKLTTKQQLVYDFVKKEVKRNGFAPSVREICDGVGLSSTSTVHAHLETLKRKGYIKRLSSKNRTIEILEEGFYSALRDYSSVPIVSQLMKGMKVLQEENITEYHLVPTSYVGESMCFMYAMDFDDSKEKIKAGDYILIKLSEKAKAGDLLLVYESAEASLRRHGQKKDSKKGIIGKVVALFRRY